MGRPSVAELARRLREPAAVAPLLVASKFRLDWGMQPVVAALTAEAEADYLRLVARAAVEAALPLIAVVVIDLSEMDEKGSA